MRETKHRCSACRHWCNWADGYGWVCSRRGGCGAEWPIPDTTTETVRQAFVDQEWAQWAEDDSTPEVRRGKEIAGTEFDSWLKAHNAAVLAGREPNKVSGT